MNKKPINIKIVHDLIKPSGLARAVYGNAEGPSRARVHGQSNGRGMDVETARKYREALKGLIDYLTGILSRLDAQIAKESNK